MPPKKKPEVEKKILLGRPSNHLKMGLVGLPNVGKSTTFNVLSNLNVPAENFPFCTIDPNMAKIFVPDQRFDKLCDMYKPKSKVMATVDITDIAGLVKGAADGAGLGNAFLSHISATDGIFHVVRAFKNDEVIHDMGDVDPIRDMEVIHGELIAKDKQALAKSIEEIDKVIARKSMKADKDEKEILLKVEQLFEEMKNVRDGDWKAGEIVTLNKHQFLTAKPVVYLVNIAEEEYVTKKNKWLPKINEWIQAHGGGPMIPYSAEFESKVIANGTDPEIRKKAAADMGAPSIINRIIRVGYSTLRLIHFFTAGPDEVRAWTVRDGSKAP